MNKQQQFSNTDKYPGSEMTIGQVNEIGSKMEKTIMEGLPETKLFSDAEIVMLQFIGAMICGSLRDHETIKGHVDYFCKCLANYADTWIKIDGQNRQKNAKPGFKLVKKQRP